MKTYTVQSFRRSYTFDTLPEAKAYAQKVFEKSGAIVGITEAPAPTVTIFRTFRNGGDVIALFPEIPADLTGYHCESYMHVGQHGAADPHPENTRPATPEEIAPLARELESIGYCLTIRHRITAAMNSARRAALTR